MKHAISMLFCITIFSGLNTVHAENEDLKHFTSGSYQQLLQQYADKPFILTVWSTQCASCIKKMPLLSKLRKEMPHINLIMIATDNITESDQVKSILSANGLDQIDNWIFAESNSAKLRREIDNKWFGEVPRTYFVDKNHERVAISGALPREYYETVLKTILN